MPYDKYGRWYAGPANMVEQNPSNQFYPSSGMPMQLSQQQIQQRNSYRQNMNSFAGRQQIQNQQDVADLKNYPKSLANAETTVPTKRRPLNQNQPEVEEEKKGGMSAAQGIAAGAGMIGTLAQAIQPSTYDRRTGLEKKGTFASLYGDNTAFKVGAATGNPIAMVGGLIVDRVKNAIMMQHERKQGKEKLSQYNLMAGINNNQMMAQPNYIGYAKNGMKAKGQLANLEQDEIAIKLGKDGKYKHIITTGPDHPSHDVGGKNYFLEQGTLVFPKKYKSKVENALAKGDTKSIDKYKNEMLVESTSKALRGEKYSNQSGIETQLQELSKGNEVATARYGAKINNMKTKYYNYGGMVGQNPYIDQTIPQGGANPYFSAPQQNFQMPQVPNQIPAQTFENGGVSGFGDPPPDLISNFADVQVDNTGMQNEPLPMYFSENETSIRKNNSDDWMKKNMQYTNAGFDRGDINTLKNMTQENDIQAFELRKLKSQLATTPSYRYGGKITQYANGGMATNFQDPPPYTKSQRDQLKKWNEQYGQTGYPSYLFNSSDPRYSFINKSTQAFMAERNRKYMDSGEYVKPIEDYTLEDTSNYNPMPTDPAAKRDYLNTFDAYDIRSGSSSPFGIEIQKKKKPVEYKPVYQGRIPTKSRVNPGGKIE